MILSGSGFSDHVEVVAQLLHAIPGIDSLTALLAIDPFTLPQQARIDYLTALERQSSWLQAALQRAIVAVAGVEPSRTEDIWGGVDDAEREDVAAALRLSGSSAQLRIDVARVLINHLPNTPRHTQPQSQEKLPRRYAMVYLR
jgi:hypothetical protein